MLYQHIELLYWKQITEENLNDGNTALMVCANALIQCHTTVPSELGHDKSISPNVETLGYCEVSRWDTWGEGSAPERQMIIAQCFSFGCLTL